VRRQHRHSEAFDPTHWRGRRGGSKYQQQEAEDLGMMGVIDVHWEVSGKEKPRHFIEVTGFSLCPR
jgi:hypothetical protein